MPDSFDKKPTNAVAPAPTTVTPSKYSIMAVISLSLSCLSLMVGPFGYIPGIIFGHTARWECKKNPQLVGRGMALAGLIVGYIGLILTIIVVLLIVKFVDVSFSTFKTIDPDDLRRMLEELQRFLSTVKT